MSTADLLLNLAFELRHATPQFSLPELDEAVQHCIVQLEESARRQPTAAEVQPLVDRALVLLDRCRRIRLA